jgi:hypothetical protein
VERDGVTTATAVIGAVLGLGYLAASIAGWIGDVGDGDDLAIWLVLLLGGGAAVLLGVFRLTTPPLLSMP